VLNAVRLNADEKIVSGDRVRDMISFSQNAATRRNPGNLVKR
jgi:hypothetical protein